MELIKRGNKLLNEVSEEVKFPLTSEDKEFLSDLQSFMFTTNPRMQGMSAIQVGVKKRIAIINIKGETFPIINPVLKHKFGIQISDESCSSCDSSLKVRDFYRVKRPMRAVVEYYDTEGNLRTYKPDMKTVRVFCHEIDHMNGTLITDIGKYYCTTKPKPIAIPNKGVDTKNCVLCGKNLEDNIDEDLFDSLCERADYYGMESLTEHEQMYVNRKIGTCCLYN